jgi:hypothetical protein
VHKEICGTPLHTVVLLVGTPSNGVRKLTNISEESGIINFMLRNAATASSRIAYRAHLDKKQMTMERERR